MAEKTGIEWCDHTFNIAWGCVKVSPGCKNCYADRDASRYGFSVFGPPATTERRTFGAKHWKEPIAWNEAAKAEGVRKRVFCSSMCDVFEDHPTIDAEREKLWPLIRATPWLDWQLLTKRPERIVANLPADWGNGYHNVWLGTSVESQDYADERIPHLLRAPAVVHWLSCEPLLGPLTFRWALWDDHGPHPRRASQRPSVERNGRTLAGTIDHLDGLRMIDWVIVGGESEWDKKRRDMDIEWAQTVRDQCVEAGVAFFLKQLGGTPSRKRGGDEALLDGRRWTQMPRSPNWIDDDAVEHCGRCGGAVADGGNALALDGGCPTCGEGQEAA